MEDLGALLTERNTEGKRLYSQIQAEDFLAALLLSQGLNPNDKLPTRLQQLLARFAQRAQVPHDASREEAERAVQAYFTSHPIPDRLKANFGRFLQDKSAHTDYDTLAKAAFQLCGEAPLAKTKAPIPDGPKGALGYFAAQKKLG